MTENAGLSTVVIMTIIKEICIFLEIQLVCI